MAVRSQATRPAVGTRFHTGTVPLKLVLRAAAQTYPRSGSEKTFSKSRSRVRTAPTVIQLDVEAEADAFP